MAVLFCCPSCKRSDDFVDTTWKLMKAPCDAVFACDLETGETEYFSGSPDTVVHPASITKLLTALAALEILPADALIQPGDEVYLPPDGSSSAFIRPHHQLTLAMLIEGMLIPSGSDAAYAAAAACGYELAGTRDIDCKEAVGRFMDYANEYAAALGCTGTHFTVPDGYAGDEHFSTAEDLLKICRAAAENPLIASCGSTFREDVVYASGHTNTWQNTNKMLDSGSSYYLESIVGLKTGSLKKNYSLVSVYDDGERRFLVGVFGAENDKGRYRITQSVLKALGLTD